MLGIPAFLSLSHLVPLTAWGLGGWAAVISRYRLKQPRLRAGGVSVGITQGPWEPRSAGPRTAGPDLYAESFPGGLRKAGGFSLLRKTQVTGCGFRDRVPSVGSAPILRRVLCRSAPPRADLSSWGYTSDREVTTVLNVSQPVTEPRARSRLPQSPSVGSFPGGDAGRTCCPCGLCHCATRGPGGLMARSL